MKPQHSKKVDAPSHHEVNRSMRPRFKRRLETNEIPHKAVYQGQLACRRNPICHGIGLTGVSRRVATTEPVRCGIRDREASSESTVGDLIVLIGVTPTPEAAGGIRVPESAVLEIRRVYHETELV